MRKCVFLHISLNIRTATVNPTTNRDATQNHSQRKWKKNRKIEKWEMNSNRTRGGAFNTPIASSYHIIEWNHRTLLHHNFPRNSPGKWKPNVICRRCRIELMSDDGPPQPLVTKPINWISRNSHKITEHDNSCTCTQVNKWKNWKLNKRQRRTK